MKHAVLALTLAALAAGPAAARDTAAGDLVVKDAVMRAVAPGVANTAGYLTIANKGSKPDKLLSAACDCARSVEVHVSHVMNGMAMMMPASAVTVPAGGQISFSPGGYHLMVMGLKAPLTDGRTQDVVLKFERAGTVKAAFDVRSRIALAAAPAMAGMDMHR